MPSILPRPFFSLRAFPLDCDWYAAFSVSQSNVGAVREYIRLQPEHHGKQSFQEELRGWLRRYEIEWDEGMCGIKSNYVVL